MSGDRRQTSPQSGGQQFKRYILVRGGGGRWPAEPPAADGRASKTDQWRRAARSQAPQIGPIGSHSAGGQWDVAGFTKLLALMEDRQAGRKMVKKRAAQKQRLLTLFSHCSSFPVGSRIPTCTDDLQPQTCHFCVVAVRSRASISVMNSRECPIEILPFQPLPLDFNPKTKQRRSSSKYS